jgi:hypothetical protein
MWRYRNRIKGERDRAILGKLYRLSGSILNDEALLSLGTALAVEGG